MAQVDGPAVRVRGLGLASLASRRYELVDPAKRHVARELEARWNSALERVSDLERRIQDLLLFERVRREQGGELVDEIAHRALVGQGRFELIEEPG